MFDVSRQTRRWLAIGLLLLPVSKLSAQGIEPKIEFPPPQNHKVDSYVLSMAFTPDGKHLACYSGELGQRAPNNLSIMPSVFTLETATGKVVYEDSPPKPPAGGARGYTSSGARCQLAVSPNGKQMAWAGMNSEFPVFLQEGKNPGRGLGNRAANQTSSAVDFSPDGKILASASLGNGNIVFWDAATGKELKQFMTGLNNISMLQFSPDSKTLACAEQRSNFALLDAGTGKLIHRWTQAGTTYPSIAFSPDGKNIAIAGTTGVSLYDAATGKTVRTIPASTSSTFAFSPDGRMLAISMSSSIQLWDGSGQTRLASLKAPTRTQTMVFSPNGRYLAAAGSGTLAKTALVWDVGTLKVTPLAAALDANEFARLWKELENDNAALAYKAVWRLAAAPKETMAYLKANLKPAKISDKVDPRRIQQLIENLNSPQFNVREQSILELEQIGRPTLGFLQLVRNSNPSPQVAKILDKLIKPLEAIPPDELQGMRAVQILELMQHPEARTVLETLARGEQTARLTQQAQAALDRLKK
jgi:Tol biopolymer transport system component